MKINELITIAKAKGMNRQAVADSAGITRENLAVKVAKGTEALELTDGRFVTVRSDAVYFDLSTPPTS